MEDNKTKEEILREAADNYVSNHADGEVRRMYGHHLRSFKDGWNAHESYSQQSTKQSYEQGYADGRNGLYTEDLKREIAEKEQSTKHLQDRIAELEKEVFEEQTKVMSTTFEYHRKCDELQNEAYRAGNAESRVKELEEGMETAKNFITVFLQKMPAHYLPSDWTDAMFAGIKQMEKLLNTKS